MNSGVSRRLRVGWFGWRSDIKTTWCGKWSYTSWRTRRGVRCTLLSWSREKIVAERVSVCTTQYQNRITYRRTYVHSLHIYWGY